MTIKQLAKNAPSVLCITKQTDLTDAEVFKLLWQGDWEHGYLQLALKHVEIVIDLTCSDPDCDKVHDTAYPVFFKFVTPELTIAGALVIPKTIPQDKIVSIVCNSIREAYDIEYAEQTQLESNGQTIH